MELQAVKLNLAVVPQAGPLTVDPPASCNDGRRASPRRGHTPA